MRLTIGRGVVALIWLLVVSAPCISAQGIITTVAGSGRVLAGDGGVAIDAALGPTAAIAVDSTGNVFATDYGNNLVVKISAAGVLTVVAGNGTRGFSGDGGPATAASLNFPYGLAVDAAGNLYIADTDNQRIRKVDAASGVISTVAGDGTGGFSGDGGLATGALLSYPSGLAMDAAGNLYIADTGNHRIRKVSVGGTISTVAGNGIYGFSGDGGPATAASLYFPFGVAVDAASNLYIVDTLNQRVRKASAGGSINTVAGNGDLGFSGDGGLATRASFNYPLGVAVDAAGNIYIADTSNCRIRKVGADGAIGTVAGNGTCGFSGDASPATGASLNYSLGVALDAEGKLYIADSRNYRVRKVGAAGTITTIAGNGMFGSIGDGGPATSALLKYPFGVAVDAAGSFYIADTDNDRIRKVDAGGTISTVAGNGTGGFSGDGGPATSASLNNPYGLVVDAAGNLYIADVLNHRIRKVDNAATISTVAGDGSAGFSGDRGPATGAALYYPQGVAVDAVGDLYIADTHNERIRKVDAGGTISTVAGNGAGGFSGDGGPATDASLNFPSAVAVDAAGNVYIADQGNLRIRRVDVGGTITTVAGNGYLGFSGDGGPAGDASFAYPRGMEVDTAGNLYIADTYNQRIRRVNGATGVISTVAGNGNSAFSGDGGEATDASLNYPYSVALDAAGNLYIADSSNNRVRKVTPAYRVGDAYPATADSADQFGDGKLDLRDLIYGLRAVTGVPGYAPPSCSDRYDAIDSYPQDAVTARGGDGALDVRDLIVTLRRVTSVDTSRPLRTLRGLACP